METDVDSLFVRAAERCEADPQAFGRIEGVYLFRIDHGEMSSWIVRCGEAPAVWRSSSNGARSEREADCVVTLSASVLDRIVRQGENPQLLYRAGLIQVTGNVHAALWLHEVFELLQLGLGGRA